MRFSANLGFLWQDRSLTDAIRAAKGAGFAAVEMHWPYEYDATELADTLAQCELPLLGINTDRGDLTAGENGLSALAGREDEARSAIDQALAFAQIAGSHAVHVMAGNATGEKAHTTFCNNLIYACQRAQAIEMMVLIEPLNHHDAPHYFLKTSLQAIAIIEALNLPNLKLMFDCYHIQIMEGDLTRRLEQCLPHMGHIQFASVPDRGRPDEGEINYHHLFRKIHELGWQAPLGAEYKPAGPTEETLGWMSEYSTLS